MTHMRFRLIPKSSTWCYRTCYVSYFQAAWCNFLEWFKLGSTHKCYPICAKLNAPRLYYLKQLRRAGLPSDDLGLLYFYLTVIRPVLEYGCAVSSLAPLLNCCTMPKLESSLQIEEGPDNHPPNCIRYAVWFCVWICGSTTLPARRSELGRRFFRSVTVSYSCLRDLLPQRRDSEILSRLRRHTVYPIPRTNTNKYRFFIHYALAK